MLQRDSGEDEVVAHVWYTVQRSTVDEEEPRVIGVTSVCPDPDANVVEVALGDVSAVDAREPVPPPHDAAPRPAADVERDPIWTVETVDDEVPTSVLVMSVERTNDRVA